MKLLADENLSGPVVRELRRRGHDVLWARESLRGARDEELLARAREESRTLLTFDKDFGALAFASNLPATCGVVLIRLAARDPASDNARLLEALTSQPDWSGRFAVIEAERIRVRPLPPESA